MSAVSAGAPPVAIFTGPLRAPRGPRAGGAGGTSTCQRRGVGVLQIGRGCAKQHRGSLGAGSARAPSCIRLTCFRWPSLGRYRFLLRVGDLRRAGGAHRQPPHPASDGPALRVHAEHARWERPARPPACAGGRCSFSFGACTSSSSPNRGRGRVVAGGRDLPPRAPVPAAPRLRGLGLTRRRCGVWWVAELGCSGWVSEAHGAKIPSAPQAVGTCGVALEDVCPMGQAQGLLTLDLTLFPGNPEDCRPSIGSLALQCHSCYLPFVQTGEGRPRSPPGRSIWWAGLLQPGISSHPPVSQTQGCLHGSLPLRHAPPSG
jgi:hypothetical protein